MNIDFEKIKKEYPKSWEKFVKENKRGYWSNGQENWIEKEKLTRFCFCDFVEFFDDNKIIINTFFIIQSGTNIESFCYVIDYKINNKWTEISDMNIYLEKTRDQIQVEVVYKAFEIMEGML